MTNPPLPLLPELTLIQELDPRQNPLRAEFEDWYVLNVFDLKRDPIGSDRCSHQWKAWKAARAMYTKGQAEGAESCRAAGGQGDGWYASRSCEEKLRLLIDSLRVEASIASNGYTFGQEAANRRSGEIADKIEVILNAQPPADPSIAVGEARCWRYNFAPELGIGEASQWFTLPNLTPPSKLKPGITVEYAYTTPRTGRVSVDDAMVERALRAYIRVRGNSRSTIAVKQTQAMRAALTTALAGPTNDAEAGR